MPKKFTYRIMKKSIYSMTELEHQPGIDLVSAEHATIVARKLFDNDLT